jgi:hypothetical protein
MEELRAIARLRVSEVDKFAGLRPKHYWTIQKRGTDPELDAVRKIAALYGCPVGYLAAGEGRRPSDAAIRKRIAAVREAHAAG